MLEDYPKIAAIISGMLTLSEPLILVSVTKLACLMLA